MKNLFASASKRFEYTPPPKSEASEFVQQSQAIKELNAPHMIHQSVWYETSEDGKGKVRVRRTATYRTPPMPKEGEWSSR